MAIRQGGPVMIFAAALALVLSCDGDFKQGGYVVCTAPPGATLTVDGSLQVVVDGEGRAIVGLDRDAAPTLRLALQWKGEVAGTTFPIAPRQWSTQKIDGLPPQTVQPTDAKVLEKIARDSTAKQAALTSRAEGSGFLESWRWPVPSAKVSGQFGNARILNGVAGRPHYGIDLAAPIGTPVVAPASGIVSLAQTGMHYEGGLVFIDHGQGLTSMYLHLSEIAVVPGQRVEAGQRIGAVGATGRATGPHLCWRLKWRDRNLDPSLKPTSPLAAIP